MDLYYPSPLHTVFVRRVSRRDGSGTRDDGVTTGRPADAPLCRFGRHGGVVSDVVSDEVPFHEPTAAHHISGRDCGVQFYYYAHDEHGCSAAGLFSCGRGEDTRHVRVHVEYPVVDDARTRFRYLLSDLAYYPADRYHRQRMARGGGCFPSELADDARADHRHDVVCGTRSTASLPTVVSDAATNAAQRHRHLHGTTD